MRRLHGGMCAWQFSSVTALETEVHRGCEVCPDLLFLALLFSKLGDGTGKAGTFHPGVKRQFNVTIPFLAFSIMTPSYKHNAPQLTSTWGAKVCRGAGGHGWGWVHMAVCTDPRYSTVTTNLSLQWDGGSRVSHSQNWRSQRGENAGGIGRSA